MIKTVVTLSILFTLLFNINPTFADDNKVIKLATTTSTENSGLLKYLLPTFEQDTGFKVHTIAVGTGKALRMGRDGDVDVLLVHALKAEQKFMTNGDGEKRFAVMYNDFVIVGPENDPANIADSKNAPEALQKIAVTNSPFISRGDDSGTHKKEIYLWKSTHINITKAPEKWYREAGQGMGKVLQMAGEMDAYTLCDRGTWLAYESKSPLKITFEGDANLFNPYGIIAVSSKKYPDLNTEGALSLMTWITSEKGQRLIGKFTISGKVLFKPNATTVARLN
ncbi:MAG: substrate-binding domain-containing protein [Cocleimonas sp.]